MLLKYSLTPKFVMNLNCLSDLPLGTTHTAASRVQKLLTFMKAFYSQLSTPFPE